MNAAPLVTALQRVGLTAYEAKAYVALLAAGEPLNGYAVAKRSGVPRSTVYETLGKLVARGAAFEVHGRDGPGGYLPLPAASLLARLRRDLNDSLDQLEGALSAVASARAAHVVQTLDQPARVLRRAEDVIASARAELDLSLWPQERAALHERLQAASERGVQVTTMAFGHHAPEVGDEFVHQFSDPRTVLERVGCRLMVVAADRREVVIGGAVGDEAWGIWSDDPAVVLVAVEFVLHDIAMQVLVDRLGADEVAAFWRTDPVLVRLATGGLGTGLPRRAAGGTP